MTTLAEERPPLHKNAAFCVWFVLFGAVSLAQAPSTVAAEIYSAVLADPSCSGRGSSPGRDRLVIDRATESLANPLWNQVPGAPNVFVRIQSWFPSLTAVEIQRVLEANAGPRNLGDDVITQLGAVATDERTMRSLEQPGWIWDNFYKRYPNSTGHIQLSAISVEPGQEQVLVYCALASGALSAKGHFYLLQSSRAGWYVVAKQLLWES